MSAPHDAHHCHDMHDDDEQKEWEHWYDVMRTFLLYKDFTNIECRRRLEHFGRLADKHKAYLPPSTEEKIRRYSNCSDVNQRFFEDLVSFQDFGFALRSADSVPVEKYNGPNISASQMHRNEAVLHSLAREWSEYGAAERAATFEPMIAQLQQHLPVTGANVYRQKVLVPGGGLSRLAVEIASMGYATEGNEFSMFMLTASHYILNGIFKPHAYTLHPFIDRTSNLPSVADAFTAISIPDKTAVDILQSSMYSDMADALEDAGEELFPRFSMSAGDFVKEYYNDKNKGLWSAVVTCFFIDTAPVVVEYLEVIQHILKPGGVWVNFGPLLYHWATGSDVDIHSDERYAQSIELSWEELKHVIDKFGFQFQQEEWREVTYASCKESMMYNTYRAKFFTVTKPLEDNK